MVINDNLKKSTESFGVVITSFREIPHGTLENKVYFIGDFIFNGEFNSFQMLLEKNRGKFLLPLKSIRHRILKGLEHYATSGR